jgi:hypothetical protein
MIYFVVGGEDGDVLIRVLLEHLEVGHACGDAECLRLVAAGHDATVVVRQHHHGLSLQVRTEHTLA